jgi:hypothetical protein
MHLMKILLQFGIPGMKDNTSSGDFDESVELLV